MSSVVLSDCVVGSNSVTVSGFRMCDVGVLGLVAVCSGYFLMVTWLVIVLCLVDVLWVVVVFCVVVVLCL